MAASHSVGVFPLHQASSSRGNRHCADRRIRDILQWKSAYARTLIDDIFWCSYQIQVRGKLQLYAVTSNNTFFGPKLTEKTCLIGWNPCPRRFVGICARWSYDCLAKNRVSNIKLQFGVLDMMLKGHWKLGLGDLWPESLGISRKVWTSLCLLEIWSLLSPSYP